MRLTQFSRGSGCGCKIAPAQLQEILQSNLQKNQFKQLLVGYDTSDDAAIYDVGNNACIISTTDFFTPIVDDPFQFGEIAAANAISDVFAMGGNPIMALGILGFPTEKFETEIESKLTDKVITDLINDSLESNYTRFNFEKTANYYLWSYNKGE
jgi:selenide,water dikinase